MNKLTKSAIAGALIASAAMANPAFAGQSTDSKTAIFSVVSTCSIAGSTINLGTFVTSNTFEDIGKANGYFDASENWIQGTRGLGYANLGSITCDSGVPYEITIRGSGPNGGILLNVGGKSVASSIWLKSIGDQTMRDYLVTGLGSYTSDLSWVRPTGVGSGAAQTIIGTTPLGFGWVKDSNGATALPTDKLGTAGTYTDTMTYTLNF